MRLAYHGADGTLVPMSLSRENIIRRVANTWDGSHPSIPISDRNQEHFFDPAVAHLMKYTVAGLPIPYFLLLKTAQDLLEIAPRLLNQSATGAA